MSEGEKVKGFNGHVYFTIDEIAHMLPGPARLMHEIGTRWWKVYYAAKEGNWALAEYEIKETKELFELSMTTRPKYVQWMDPFMGESMKRVEDALKAKNWTQFEEAYNQSVKDANDYHKAANKPLIHWKLPSTPPQDIELKPQP